MPDYKQNTDGKRMREVLDSFGIQLTIEGCGCCDSPQVKFAYKGETLVDHADFNFTNDPAHSEISYDAEPPVAGLGDDHPSLADGG